MRLTVIGLAVVMIAAACGCQEARTKSDAKTSEGTARLSETDVLKAADQFAKEQREKYEPFDLKFYPDRTAKFDPQSKIWSVFYWRKPNRRPGDHFWIKVDDTTGEKKYRGGE